MTGKQRLTKLLELSEDADDDGVMLRAAIRIERLEHDGKHDLRELAAAAREVLIGGRKFGPRKAWRRLRDALPTGTN